MNSPIIGLEIHKKTDVDLMTADKDIAEFCIEASQSTHFYEELMKWVKRDLFSASKSEKKNISALKIKPSNLAEIINQLMNGMINSRISKIRFSDLIKKGKKLDIVKCKSLDEIINEFEIKKISKELIESSGELVKKYKSGKTTVANYFVGKIMQRIKSNADPKTVLQIVKSILDRV